MRVAILVKEFPPDVIGGTETQTERMAAALSSAGQDVTVYTKSYGTPNDDETRAFDVVRVPNLRTSPFISTMTFVLLATLYLLKDARRYDVLQCMMIYPNGFVGYLVNKVRGVPYVAWIRGGDYYFMKENRIKRWTIRRVFSDTLVLTVSDRVIEDVEAEFRNTTLRAVTNGIEMPEETAAGDAIVFVGRLKEQKGVHVLLRAVADVDVSVLIVGDGPERSALERLADELSVDATFVGEVHPEEVPEYLRRGTLFALPSIRGEGGAPNAVLEAMASGLPVVVTDTGGMIRTIDAKDVGVMVEPGDREALRAAIEDLLDDAERRRRMGENARAYVRERHAWPAIVDELEDVYERVRSDRVRTG